MRVRDRVQPSRRVGPDLASDLARVEAEVVADFRAIYETRRRIFLLKLSSKFALGAISALGKVGILFLGGWLVLTAAAMSVRGGQPHRPRRGSRAPGAIW